jgi:hypothetical protein
VRKGRFLGLLGRTCRAGVEGRWRSHDAACPLIGW